MKKDGYMLICDRCNAKQFIEIKEENDGEPEGWLSVNNKHICPKCSDRFQKLLDNFIKRR